ncbi:MAG: hypothetical protein D6729_04210 [Deltaproteobacteria bacterium]|nr:MAG: hypothetical protein D6729_04210 [Deltaproteobacteria bacterium]
MCGLGEVCVDGVGCQPVPGGSLGGPCGSDSDCAGLLPACVDGRAECVCMISVGGTQAQGVCLALPVDFADCDACGDEAVCVNAGFTSGGAGGAPVVRKVCAPRGLTPCTSERDCVDPGGDFSCAYLGWPADPNRDGPGFQVGLTAVCMEPLGLGAVGQGCTGPGDCRSGLCLPRTGGTMLCSAPCAVAGDCDEACVSAPVSFGSVDPPVVDVVPVCGSLPTLGAVCAVEVPDRPAPQCGTDAPLCVQNARVGETVCARPCRDEADCGPPTTCEATSRVCLDLGL